MAEKKKTEVKENLEREYVIPLREKSRPVPRYKKTPKAVKTVKEFLVRHMKIRDRDLKKIKIDPFLNEILWFRGIKKHPHKIKVKVIKKGDIVEVSAVELPKYLEFKKKRLDKRETNAQEIAEKKKTLMQKAKESLQAQPKADKPEEKKDKDKDKDNDGVEDKVEEKEKQKSVGEAAEKQAKAKAKEIKHSTGGKAKQKTAPVRKALSR